MTLGLIERFRHERADWSPADEYTGVAFLPGHVCWLVRKDVNSEPWYGTGNEVDQEHRNPPAWFTPSYAARRGVDPYADTWMDEAEWRAAWEAIGFRDPWNDAKGFHCETRGVWLLAYKWPIVPGDEGEILKLDGFHAPSDCGGLAFDGGTGRLYVFEGYPPDETTERGVYPKESPRIHVYNLEVDGAGEPEPEPEPAEKILLHVDGIDWEFSGDDEGRQTAIAVLSDPWRRREEYPGIDDVEAGLAIDRIGRSE